MHRGEVADEGQAEGSRVVAPRVGADLVVADAFVNPSVPPDEEVVADVTKVGAEVVLLYGSDLQKDANNGLFLFHRDGTHLANLHFT